jgi:hypothetical protein
MLTVNYEIKFKPLDESTLNVPEKKIGRFFEQKTLPQKSLAYFRVRFYVVTEDRHELDGISKVVYRVPSLGISITKDNKETDFEFNLTTSEKKFTLCYEILFTDRRTSEKESMKGGTTIVNKPPRHDFVIIPAWLLLSSCMPDNND